MVLQFKALPFGGTFRQAFHLEKRKNFEDSTTSLLDLCTGCYACVSFFTCNELFHSLYIIVMYVVFDLARQLYKLTSTMVQ